LGFCNHCDDRGPVTIEGQVVKLSDKIAYINHDIDDAIRGGVLRFEDLPRACIERLGVTHSQRINTMVWDVVQCTDGKTSVCMSDEIGEATMSLRDFLFREVYIGSSAKKEEQKARNLLKRLYEHYVDNPSEMYEGKGSPEGTPVPQAACDYVAGMTDRFAVAQYRYHFLPAAWKLDY